MTQEHNTGEGVRVNVKALEWGALRYTDDYSFASDAATPIGTYIATDTGWFLQGRTGWIDASNMDVAKAAAQADFDKRILSCLDLTLSQPTTVGEAEVVGWQYRFKMGNGEWSAWTWGGVDKPPTPEDLEVRPLVTLASLQAMQSRAQATEARVKELEEGVENAQQAMSETHSSWESRCHAIMAALGMNYGRIAEFVPDEDDLETRTGEADNG